MLSTLSLQRKESFINRRKAVMGGFSLGGNVPITPASFPNLQNWFKPGDISCPLGNTNDWLDSQNVAEKLTGVSCISGSSCNCIGTLNGYSYLSSDISPASIMSYTTPGLINHNTFTVMGVLSSSGASFGNGLSSRTNVGSTAFLLMQEGTGKLQFYARTNNGQTAICNSITNWNGAGFGIFCFAFDNVGKDAYLWENGNEIKQTNALMDNPNFMVPAFYLNSNSTGSAKWAGGFGEFFIYDDLKTTTVINKLGKYLADKYSLTWTDV